MKGPTQTRRKRYLIVTFVLLYKETLTLQSKLHKFIVSIQKKNSTAVNAVDATNKSDEVTNINYVCDYMLIISY